MTLKQEQTRGIIRVANIIEEGRYAGPQAQIVAVAEKAQSKGINTIVICPEKESERFYAEALKRGIEIRSIPMHRLSRNPVQILQYFLTFPKEVFLLRKLLKSEKIDIVHCNSARQFKGVVAGRFSGKKVIWHLQDTFSPNIIKALFFILAFFVDYFITAGKRVQQYYLGRFPLNRKPVKAIQAPVDTQVFAPNQVAGDERIASSPGIKIVSVGNVNPAKGFEYYIEAASRTTCRNDNASFWIVGPRFDSQRRYFDLLAQAGKELNVKVHFYGPSTNVRSVLKAGDIYVCSSVHEASPISVWEAMAMEKAIVSTDVGDVSEFISDGENGFIVPVGDAYQLAEKISILIKNPSMRSEFGKKARIAAIEKLDLTIAVKRHVEVYKAVIENRGG